jgi:3-isopropylmalate/(R)-2-methylmalate dehydratase small subunit
MIWNFGDNINTDLITPGRYNITTNPKELAKIVFIEYSPDFNQKVSEGDLIVAGNNFGCGSSRETAATGLKAAGIEAIIAQSFARIFYRNCLNQGLLAIVADTSEIDPEDELEIDYKGQKIINKTKEIEIKAEIPGFMLELKEVGGMINYIKLNGTGSISKLFQEQKRDV